MSRRSVLARTLAVLSIASLTGPALHAQPARSSSNRRTIPNVPELRARLDSIARDAVVHFPLASASVVVLRGTDTLLNAAYGEADLSLHVPATTRTRYRWIGPGFPVFVAAVLQQVANGKLSLDDDAARYLPDFPWQGRRVTVRQLLNATAGLPDYHYLGDAFYIAAATPKTTADITALFAGQPFVHEPGARWSWSVSGYHLAGVILEQLTHEPYAAYATTHVLSPAGLRETSMCGDADVVPDLARGYSRDRGTFSHPVYPSATTIRFLNDVCGTALDAARLTRALPTLLGSTLTRTMLGLDRPPVLIDGADSASRSGLIVRLGREAGHRWWGFPGGWWMGYGSTFQQFDDDSLTVVVLTNTYTQDSQWLAHQLARTALGEPTLATPWSARSTTTVGEPVSVAEGARLVGTYDVRAVPETPSQYRQMRRTVRVYEEAGRVMVAVAGDEAAPLLRQRDGRYVRAYGPERWFVFSFAPSGGPATALSYEGPQRLTGPRVR